LNIAKGKLKQKYADLTDDNLKYAEDRSDELSGRVQEKTGESKENLKKMINDL
jgi:uncharacterized protein YjbJ (UPF0337 family)